VEHVNEVPKPARPGGVPRSETALSTHLQRQLEVASRGLLKALGHLDSAVEALEGHQRLVAKAAGLAGSCLGAFPVPPDPAPRLMATPAAGVFSLVSERLANGGAKVSVNGGPPIGLPPILNDLLEILAEDAGPSLDRFVAHKVPEKVIKHLARISGQAMKRHALNGAIYRLRLCLERGGIHRDCVQVDRRRGMRFLRLRAVAVQPPASAPTLSAASSRAAAPAGAP
jgi:hypothetical protein